VQFGKIEMHVLSSRIHQAIRRWILHGGGARGGVGRVVSPPRAADSNGQQSGRKNFCDKKNGFLTLNFKLFGEVEGKSISNRVFFKCLISVRDGRCVYSSRAQSKP